MNVTLAPAVRYISANTLEELVDICTTPTGAALAADQLAYNGHAQIQQVTVLLAEGLDEPEPVDCEMCQTHRPDIRFAGRPGIPLRVRACGSCQTRLGLDLV